MGSRRKTLMSHIFCGPGHRLKIYDTCIPNESILPVDLNCRWYESGHTLESSFTREGSGQIITISRFDPYPKIIVLQSLWLHRNNYYNGKHFLEK